MYSIYSYISRKRVSIVFWALLFLLCYNSQSFAQYSGKTHGKPSGLNSWTPSYLLPSANSYYGLDSPGPDSVVRTDFTITLRDGVVIDCLKYIPLRSSPPAGGYFTVIMVHGYGDNKNTLATFCHDQASYGYYTMTFSVRGQGLSGGLSNLISNVEALDLLEVIQWVKNDSLHGSNPNKILIMGGSQGGLLPMKAICMGGRPVTTIISALAPPNFASSWIENGTIKMTALWTMDYTPDTARYTQQVINMRNWILADTKPLWDSLNRTLPIGRDFVTSLPNCQTPVFVEGSWQDKFFNASGWLDNITSLNVPLTSYFGAVQGHGGDHSATEDNWHMNWFNNWFFQWLWDMNTGILTSPKYQYAYTTFPVVGSQYWTFVHDSSATPLNNISTNLRLYFSENKKLSSTFDNNNSNKASFNNKIGSNYTLTQAIDAEFKGTTFNNKFKVDSTVFTSNALTAPLKWVGTPTIKLDYSSSASTFCQFNMEIYEVQASGIRRFIDRADFTDRNYTANTRRTAIFKGQAHAHKFLQGSRIYIKITNLDRVKEDTAFFGQSNPFSLPVMKNGTNNVFLSNNCYIDLPVVNQVGQPLNLFTNENGEETGTNGPNVFKLIQNYPNPFNPSTTIEYSIASAQKVELKVYDVLGREVATLVNEIQNPGSYNVMFNASNLSSGIYFYKLVSGSFTDIKKMVLVK